MCKIRELLVEEQRHIRFGEWKDKEVMRVFNVTLLCGCKRRNIFLDELLRQTKFFLFIRMCSLNTALSNTNFE